VRTPRIQPLFNREYYEKLLEVLGRANRSVYVIMYVAKYDPKGVGDPVNRLLDVLAQLRSKGVEVRVVVDDETYRSYRETVEYLKNRSIGVRLDPGSRTTTHAKVVIVDGWVVFVGSHNWTESALTLNNEVGVVIHSEGIAQRFVEYFENLWTGGRQA
jgi:phosphatidylserine/phosphatidylglycerophosphate/cardiolipin synthase-like enzyme